MDIFQNRKGKKSIPNSKEYPVKKLLDEQRKNEMK